MLKNLFSKKPNSSWEVTGSKGSNSVHSAVEEDISPLCYTSVKDLSDLDVNQYEAAEFQYIPLLPPPKELCFTSSVR